MARGAAVAAAISEQLRRAVVARAGRAGEQNCQNV
jgi:hypothetical protein